jgi:hypothetical protein
MQLKLSLLLAARRRLLRQVQLANLAYCYQCFAALARRTAAAGLRGAVLLQRESPADERYWPTLVSLDGRQAMVEEHFAEDDVRLLSDGLAFAFEGEFDELRFDLAELGSRFVLPLRHALSEAGVEIDAEPQMPAEDGSDGLTPGTGLDRAA